MSPSATYIILVSISIATLSRAERILANVSHHYPDHEVFFGYQHFDRENVTYAVCDRANSDCQPRKTCLIYLESYAAASTCDNVTRIAATSRVCNVSVDSEGETSLLNRFVRVNQFGRDRSIVTFWEDDSAKDFIGLVKFAVVDFTDCQVGRGNLSLPKPRNNSDDYVVPFTLIPYGDKFDVLSTNADYYGGAREKLRKITFDARGDKVEEIDDWVTLGSGDRVGAFGIPVEMDEGKVAHVVIEQETDTLAIQLVRDGAASALGSYACEPRQSAFSTSFKTAGICCYCDELINCTQFDVASDTPTQLLSTSIPLEHLSYAMQMANVATGGFVLLTAKYVECEEKFCDDTNTYAYYLTKIDASGKRTGSTVTVGQQSCSCPRTAPHYKLFNVGKNEYCVSMACVYVYYQKVDDKSGYLNLTTKCFNDDDLMGNRLA